MGLNFETKRKIVYLLSVSILLGNFAFPSAGAQTSTDALDQQRLEKQQKLLELNKQIKQYSNQINETRKKSNTLKNEIFIYDKEIASTQLQIEAKETQIEDTNLQISETEKLIAQKTKEISENKKILAELIKELNQYDSEYLLKTTLGSNNLSDFLDQIQYTQNFQGKIYQLTQKIKDLKAKLEQQKKDLEIQLKNLEELKAQLEITKKSIQQQQAQKQSLLNQTRGLEKNYQKLLSVSQKEEANLQKEIEDLDAQIRAKLGKRTITASKGVIAWPMDGVLTQGYGNTGFTALGYTFHNGIDVAAPAAEPIYAAADGVVLYTDHSDASYGNWVAIKHEIATKNGTAKIITLYAHFRSFKVSVGQKVSQGDLLGYEGNTGNTTKKLYGPERGYHIHFGVYDAEGFGVTAGKYQNIYGPYMLPFGYTYNPLDFL
ncbi:MAG: peptidoglycan DD-metalloendopeptidase family protein [Candidatus Doudnabacteria bacterium]|nr:peptidoglycan DD-metalloendopeptidase family protein [Candidatus Doudnabacteria bacterium]